MDERREVPRGVHGHLERAPERAQVDPPSPPSRDTLCLVELHSVDSNGNRIVLRCMRSAWHRRRCRFRAPGGIRACRDNGGGPMRLEGIPYPVSWLFPDTPTPGGPEEG